MRHWYDGVGSRRGLPELGRRGRRRCYDGAKNKQSRLSGLQIGGGGGFGTTMDESKAVDPLS